ncbi:MAG: fused MFS/spermidine synthase [Thermoleophilaceae bacterium]|nr:fused MFS/spermidine synthase [Thermoleophilaceae bacterium]
MPPLGLLVFVVGSGSLGAEIAAVRLLAPDFGASTIVWANTIGVVLVALALGYWLGGRLADRHPQIRALCLLALAAAALLAAVPFAAAPLLDVGVEALDSVSAGAFVGSLLAVLALVAVPVLLLGAVSPWALRLAVADVENAGKVAGRLYAISTAGSLLGTLLSALVLIPLVGTRRTFLVLALAIALTALAGLRPLWRWAAVPAAIAALALLPPGALRANPAGRVVYEAETPYQYAQVVEQPDGSRVLELNEGQARHSLWRPGTVLTGGYWDEFLVLPFAARDSAPRRIAILGNAAGTTARAYGALYPRTVVHGVEIDPELTRIGRRWFGLRGPRLRVFTVDARPFLRRARDRYDSIFVDAYRQPYIPFYLTTREFFELARARLEPGGSVIVNVGQPEGQFRLERVLAATMRTAFRTVLRDHATPTNTLLLATDSAASAARLRRNARGVPSELAGRARAAAARLEPALAGGEVYTDDRAPVEWLVDGSLLDYAAGPRR